MSKPERRLIIELPDDERGLGPYHQQQFDRLQRKLARLHPINDAKKRDEVLDEIQALETNPLERREQTALNRRIAETVALAQGRGEEVKATKTGPRIVSRGGLTQAYEDGHITPDHGPETSHDLYAAGTRYRDAYEIVEGLTSSSGGGAGYGPKAPQVRMVEAGAELLVMRTAIGDRNRKVLDLVCGKDVRLRAAATELHRGFPSTRNSLRTGLTIIAALKVEKAKASAGLDAKTAAIARAQNAA